MLTVLYLAATFFGMALVDQPVAQSRVNEYATRYKQTKSEHEKLLLCIEAIDNAVIYRGVPVRDVDTIFGTDYAKRIPAKGEPDTWGVVHFGRELKSPSDNMQATWEGWYMAFEFDWSGNVQDYHLSNLHK